jgi:hypothetical protein
MKLKAVIVGFFLVFASVAAAQQPPSQPPSEANRKIDEFVRLLDDPDVRIKRHRELVRWRHANLVRQGLLVTLQSERRCGLLQESAATLFS